MKLVQVIGKKLIEGKPLTANEKYTIEVYLKEVIDYNFKRMSFKEVSDILNGKMEMPSLFVVESVSEMMGNCVKYSKDNRDEIAFELEKEYYDFCIEYLGKLADKKHGHIFPSAMKAHSHKAPAKKCNNKVNKMIGNVKKYENSVKSMF